MADLVKKKHRWFYWSFLFSTLLMVVAVAAMAYSTKVYGTPFRLSIDFSGGSLLELSFKQPVTVAGVRDVLAASGVKDDTIQTADNGTTVIIHTIPLQVDAKTAIEAKLQAKFGDLTELSFQSVGPVIGSETTRAAVLAIAASSVAILLFITFAFRNVSNAFRFGICAIVEMLHDIIVLLGFASLMGILAGWEVDSLYLTAVLTVAGFSVQDAIVVFDRIRENIIRRRGEPFELIVNRSMLEMLHRSLAIQLNTMVVMTSIILFGGATIQHFIATMLVGMISGTYSSLCVGVPLLVVWEQGEIGGFFRRLVGRRAATS
jgi:preprotein translocase subunit SecF